MDFWHSVSGMVRVELTSPDVGDALQLISQNGITIYDAQRQGQDIAVHFQVERRRIRNLRRLAQKRGWGLEILDRSGIYWWFKAAMKRPVMVVGVALFLFLAMFLPSRILFIRVEGNVNVPTRLILEKSAQCGISFGASRRDVRSQKMKDALLHALPQLRWAGVNTSGCVATITVRERTVTETVPENAGLSSIVAARDGVITEMTVLRGNARCQVGQTVKKGDVLISGITDCGLTIQLSKASGEVYAQTERQIEAIFSSEWAQMGDKLGSSKKYALIIGKKRINFYKMSGNSGSTCDKIYTENYVTLPGGFVLPVAIVTEVWTYAENRRHEVDEDYATQLLKTYAEDYLRSHMVAGSIVDGYVVSIPMDKAYRLEGKYACTEMIGQVQNEEIGLPNGNDN